MKYLFFLLIISVSFHGVAQDATEFEIPADFDDEMNGDELEFFYYTDPASLFERLHTPGVKLQFPDGIPRINPADRKEMNFPLYKNIPLPYAQDLMDCLDYGKEKGGKCGNCAKGVRHALMCLHKKMTGAENHEKILCGRGAYAYAQNECMEKMGFEKVTGDEHCRKPGAIRVYEGHKTNNYANCNKYQNGNYCGHIEFVGADNRYYDTVCAPQDKPRNENAAKGTRILVACYHLKQWTDSETWYR